MTQDEVFEKVKTILTESLGAWEELSESYEHGVTQTTVRTPASRNPRTMPAKSGN